MERAARLSRDPRAATAAACLLAALLGAGLRAADRIPYRGAFKVPELEVVWRALNAPRAEDLAMEWRDIDPRKDPSAPPDWWECWTSWGLLPFHGGVRLPADTPGGRPRTRCTGRARSASAPGSSP
ncbi:MAG: hypothetical protein HY721_31230 [Planctomycetes bacterium]|nr:hypothetical protein [Planctomycetota bacterium]